MKIDESQGYSGKLLWQKLGLRPGLSMAVASPPANYRELLGELPENIQVGGEKALSLDFLHIFLTTKADLERHLVEAKGRVKPAGMIWVSWPKGSSRKTTDLTENVIRDAALGMGLVDVKVCSVDETWSGLKLVRRLKDRG